MLVPASDAPVLSPGGVLLPPGASLAVPDYSDPPRPRDPLAEAFAEVLCRQPWHWFANFTFRPEHEGRAGGAHPEKADKAFRYFASHLNGSLYGRNWHRKPHGGVIWARGQEFHKSGRIHFHAVLAAPDVDLDTVARRMDWVDWWWREYGTARIYRPESQHDVCGYVSKYVVKGGEVDFSRNFGRVLPPALF